MDNLRKYSPAYFERSLVPAQPTVGQTIGASLGYNYAPITGGIADTFNYGGERDAGYKPLEDIGDYKLYADSLVYAKNPQHMAALKKRIDDGIGYRQQMSEASIGSQLVAGIIDPINLVGLPFGGPVVGVGRSALRVGAGTMAIQAGVEGASQVYDPLRSAEESALNIAGAGIFGAGIGAAIGGVKVRAHTNTVNSLRAEFDALRRVDNLGGMTREDIANAAPRSERGYGELDDAAINENLARLTDEANRIEAEAEAGPLGQDLRDRADQLRAEARPYANELGLRSLEEMGANLKDPYSIAPSWFTDSPLFKMVTTPMKRALQSKYPSNVKEAFVRSFGDSGIMLAMNSIGVPSPQSVYQRSAVSNGRWVAAHDQLVKLWAGDTSAPQMNPLDYNLADIKRRALREPDTYRGWLQNVNEKRIKNASDLTESEIKAVEVINKYFSDAEKRLEEVGLIGTQKGMKNKIQRAEAELTTLRQELESLSGQVSSKSIRESRMIAARVSMLEKQTLEMDNQLSALSEFNVNPERDDVFFPRFWDQGAIKSNRDEFEQVLYNWYSDNPRVFDYDPETASYVSKELSTSPDKIMERVKQTVARILNETDPTNVDVVSFGHGRSKHFRHRQVDIPNKLVTKFMVTDPLAAMKTYAARIEPRYEYAKAFGKDVDGVLFDLERSMIRSGSTDEQINRMRRDYLHMYDRVAGAVIRNPDSLNQKAAFFLREAASFSYMGSAGLSAVPDFGRIVMEYDLENVMRGVQGLMDKNTVSLTVDEIRLAGEAIDILKGSAHMRMVEDLSNNVDANDLLSTARNAFYTLNGLAPLTTIAKQLAGIVDAHTIIDYSVKLTKGQLDDQSKSWLARYGIGPEEAARISRAPWQTGKNGLIYADTERWADNIFIPEIEGNRVKIIEVNEDGTPVGKQRGDRYIPAFYDPNTNIIRFDRDYIEGPMFAEKAWLNPKVEGVDALPDIFKTPKQWSNFVMLHEIMHTRFRPEDVGIFARDISQEPIQVRVASDSFTFERSYYSVGMMRREFDRLEAEVGNQSELLSAYRSQNVPTREVADLIGNYEQNVSILEELARLLDTPEYITRAELENAAGKIRSLSAEQKAQYENRINQLALEEYKSQQTINQETVQTFRTALNSGVLNTIMSGTPADKPIITDGVAYIPMRVAKQFGMKEDSRYRGYARIENGFMGLPFQFYSYTLANVNKTIGVMAQGQVKNRAIGMATMMGLAYMSLKIRTPNYVWEDMEWQDKFVRSFDASGVMALYSDLFYTSMHTSLALGGPNITGGLLSPKFPQQPSMLDAATGLAGAGPSWLADTAGGVYQFANGEYGEGAKTVARNMPFARLWFLKDDINQITRAWAN